MRSPVRVACLAALSACSPASPAGSQARLITNGAVDTGDPAVVALVSASGQTLCSGTLIEEHSVLTAGHCAQLPAASLRVFFGTEPAAGGSFARVSQLRVHPGFEAATFANDLALLTLRDPGPAGPLPLAQPIAPTLAGQTVRVVGFGVTAAGAEDGGVKRTGTSTVSTVEAGEFTTTPDPSQPCLGDSGGAALLVEGTTTVLAGVISHGDAACVDHTVFARIDVAEETFIQAYLAETAPGTATTGDACLYEEQCDDGPCLQAVDAEDLFFCGRPCAGDDGCPSPMVCVDDACRHPLPSPGAPGWPCETGDECASQLCFVDPDATSGVCTVACLDAEATCPAGFTCRNLGGLDSVCVPDAPASCGCRARPGAPPGARPAYAILVLALAASRARQRASRGSAAR